MGEEASTGQPALGSAEARRRAALKGHLEALWARAKRERQPRELKWLRNEATEDGLVTSAGHAGRRESPGKWRQGDADTGERLKVARQKIVAGCTALGESIYKAGSMPFILDWASGFEGPDSLLEAIRKRAREIALETQVASFMRLALQFGATYGEYWLHGVSQNDKRGRLVGGIEVPNVWEMYFDPGCDGKLAAAEYVIRSRMLTRFEVARLVSGANGIFDAAAVKVALQKAGARRAEAQQGTKAAQDGRERTEVVPWLEFWCAVPRKVLAGDDGAAPTMGADEQSLEWVEVFAVLADGEVVALVESPGPRPYCVCEWDLRPTKPYPEGVCDALESTQQSVTGAVGAWLTNVRRGSNITLAGKRDLLRKDPEQIGDGVTFIDLDPDCKDVRQAVQQIELNPMTSGLVEGISMLLDFADLESHISRVQQGQQPVSDKTAFELRARLAAGTKYFSEIARRHDTAIEFAAWWITYMMAIANEIAHEEFLSIIPKGFATFSDLVARIEGLLRLLSLGNASPMIDARLNHRWIVGQIALADDIAGDKAFLSDDEYQAQQQAQAESEERRLALAKLEGEARLAGSRADAAAADAEQSRGRVQLDRARFIKQIEDEAAGRAAPAAGAGPATESGKGAS